MKLLTSLAIPALCASVAAPVAAATFDPRAVALSLAGDGQSIVTIAGASKGKSVALTFDGGAKLSLDDIDYRPATGRVYGYDDETDTTYLIDLRTGKATAQATLNGATTSGNLGFDFNNRIDAARVVTDNDDNAVYTPNTVPQAISVKTDLFYIAGDVNEGVDPNVVMNAYTNAVAGATDVEQYVIDTGLDIFGELNNNAGDITTEGQLFLDGVRFDAQGDGGFDILSFFEGDNTGYALLTNLGMQALYTIELEANSLGRIDLFKVADLSKDYGPLTGLTVFPSPVPLPASALLLLGAVGLLGAAARKRRA